jgi:endonuclease-3
MMKLPGVGIKTANVVVSNAFGTPAIAVDTHVQRVSNRMGLVYTKDVHQTESDLMKRIPKTQWTKMHHVLIFHGRYKCKARSPECETCPVNHLCIDYRKRHQSNDKE